MQQRAGLLFLAKNTGRLLLILEDQKWTVPTFTRSKSLLEDVTFLLDNYSSGKIIPVELYLSKDKGFEYSTYVCLVEYEFLTSAVDTFAWCKINSLPKSIHSGLKNTISDSIIQAKIETILELENAST